jgi:uncharacterized protein (TIGR03435 family)
MPVRRTLLLFATLAAPLVLAQPPAPSEASAPPAYPRTLSFDVASIRENTTHDQHTHNSIYNTWSNSRFTATNVPLKMLLQWSFDIPESRIFGAPAWLDSTTFDIEAKSDASVDEQMAKMPPDQAKLQKLAMMQALLTDRFKLVTHTETREMPVFDLVVAKGGPRFKPSDASGTTISASGSGVHRIHVQGSDNTIELLARELAQPVGRIVIDKTGIDGRYDVTLLWTPDDAPPPLLNGAPDPNPPPDIYTALQEQLGLKLESIKGPVNVLVIDHVAPPSAN